VQEGSLGLLDAIASFDSERGADFPTYARFRVRRAIRNALTEQSRLIRLPKQIVERNRAVGRAAAGLTAATGHVPTIDELAAVTGLSSAAVLEAQGAPAAPVSLDQPLVDDGGTLEAVLVDARAINPELEAIDHEQVELVDDAVAHLPGRQREVVVRHFGLGREAEEIAEVAAALHLSRQRTRTIERDALYRLRDRLERRG
jgi:RNA polymerase primary sigma factor